MNPITTNFVKKKFREYYTREPLPIPPDLEKREWGLLMFDPASGMRRHIAFGSPGELQDYVQAMVPAHLYHSAAYYQTPGASTMKEKTWLGTDLIFDLDADHLPQRAHSYKDMLEDVKKETLKLIDFLTDDFGFEDKKLHIAFSGRRGYHIHIRDPRVLPLNSAQRREIVDYLNGTGLDIDHIIKKKYIEGDDKTAQMLSFPSESQGGWGRLINRRIISHLQELTRNGDAVERLTQFKNIGKKKALKIIGIINDPHHMEQLREGNFDALSLIPKEFWETLLEQVRSSIGAHIDEPVTADVKRLIRAAGSLHGGSGMKVITLSASELKKFDPLKDAVVFGSGTIKINVIKPSTVEMMEKQFQVEEGINLLPEYAAMYLMCRGAAEYVEENI